MGARDTGWTGAMGLIDGDVPWGYATLERGDGIDLWGCVMGACNLIGIDLWWHTMGVQHWLDLGDGIDLWGRTMGVRDTG